ncbi:hypothetical protein PF010_g28013 [Phytophthora fragariae]|uniref:Reverse transcriptase domain-containing protein n=2 Tax=Phytophthora fragariae TaxID=53985 RepID=A0A6G0JSB0_9STRA|nr:hypothetical protein PF010_g28013 [Phytophthora fragariae]
MSECVFRRLKDVCPDIVCVELETPITCATVGGNVEVSQAVDVHVTLRTAAGPVPLSSPVQCLIVPGDLEEFLLGKDVLVALGIGVDRELELLALQGKEEECDDFDEPEVSPRVELSDELSELIQAMVEKARVRGFPAEYLGELHRIATRFDLWRAQLDRDPPARVPPMRIRLKPETKPYKCKARKYPPEVRHFMEEFNQKLEELGWIYENPNSRWACPALPVRKSGSDGYRQTADYKPVNIQVDGIAGVMPNPQVDLELVKGCEFFGLFDFIKGYWQIALDEACQEILSYMTDRKIYTPRRVPQGCCDAALFFQATVEKCLQELMHKHLLVWIDDLMLYATDVQTYLIKLDRLFELLDFFGFMLSVTKSSLYEPQVKWCGKIISGRGVSHDPERIKALARLPYPSNAGELQQFLCAGNWMRESVIDFARVAKPLQEKLDEALATATRRTKRVASGIGLELGSSGRHAFDELKTKLQNAATLAFPDPDAVMCLITDASDAGYGLIVTQVREWQPKKSVAEQQHELLVCVSGTFTGSKRNWSVIEKEADPIICACDQLSHLLLRPQGFRLFCDHRNLIYVFAPGKEVKKHIRGKLLRWAVKLMEYRYHVEHIEGASNVWADMISRWAGNHNDNVALRAMVLRKRGRREEERTQCSVSKRLRGEEDRTPRTRRKRRRGEADRTPLTRREHNAPSDEPATATRVAIRPFDDPSFTWPTLEEIISAQERYVHTVASDFLVKGQSGKGWYHNKRLWIPSQCNDLRQRLMVIAHCGAQGHRGRAAMMEQLQRQFHVDHLRSKVDKFLASCLLCMHVKGGKIVQRPWSESFRCHERNGALHWDFLTVGESFGDDKYLLVLKDHATHYCELVPCATPTSAVAVAHSRLARSIWYTADLDQ